MRKTFTDDKKNQILVSCTELDGGFENCSEEFFYDYWENREFTPKDELPTPDSYYFIFDWQAPFTKRPDALITYGTDIFFAAGYIKYLALAQIGMYALLTDEQYDDFYESISGFSLMDIDEILENGKRKSFIAWKVRDQIIEIKEICEKIFFEIDRDKQNELLSSAVELFNKYFGDRVFRKVTGYGTRLTIHLGVKNAKDDFLRRLQRFILDVPVMELFEKEHWTDADAKNVVKLINLIV